MRVSKVCLAVVMLIAGSLTWLLPQGRTASAQFTPEPSSAQQSARPPYPGAKTREDANPLGPAMQERIEKSRQSERQKKLMADTDRLLALANELKMDVDKTTKDTMSVQVIRKAEEIEKLARSVKDRMKG